MSARLAPVSVHGVTRVAEAAAIAAWSSASVGTFTPLFCGIVARMTRLSSLSSERASADASASVMVGRSSSTSLYSYSMPGLGSSLRK